MLVIPQAKPQSPFFKVFVPGNTPVHHHDKIECQCPTTGNKASGICLGIITEYWENVPRWMCHETYGLPKDELRKKLETDIPAFKSVDTVKILIIKQN